MEAATREDFGDHDLGSGLTYATNGRPQYLDTGADTPADVATYSIEIGDAHRAIAASPSFPRNTGDQIETITTTDRGEFWRQSDKVDAIAVCNGAAQCEADTRAKKVRGDSYPERFSAQVPGTLMGAPGTFLCVGSAADKTCTITYNGTQPDGSHFYTFGGDGDGALRFIPSSKTSKVIIPDAEYMWFGWWSRKPLETSPTATFDFAANYGGTNLPGNLTTALGTATYVGAAVGQYGVYDVEAAEDDRSRTGRFVATATLNADFGDDSTTGTVSGSITNFDTEPDWSLTLKSQTISAAGAVTAAGTNDMVSWSIRGTPREGGKWEAQFHKNVAGGADSVPPEGVVGAFTAQYGPDRRLIGAFGAER